jgi:hypothetical protein
MFNVYHDRGNIASTQAQLHTLLNHIFLSGVNTNPSPKNYTRDAEPQQSLVTSELIPHPKLLSRKSQSLTHSLEMLKLRRILAQPPSKNAA